MEVQRSRPLQQNPIGNQNATIKNKEFMPSSDNTPIDVFVVPTPRRFSFLLPFLRKPCRRGFSETCAVDWVKRRCQPQVCAPCRKPMTSSRRVPSGGRGQRAGWRPLLRAVVIRRNPLAGHRSGHRRPLNGSCCQTESAEQFVEERCWGESKRAWLVGSRPRGDLVAWAWAT